jgi:hypothetical protein
MKKWMVSLTVVGAMSLAVAPQLAADHHEQGGMQMTDEQKAEMEKWMELAAPGKPHQEMAMFEGAWDAETTAWMVPGAEPVKSQAVSMNKVILGGRYLVQEYKGQMMGMDFEGFGLMAYDNYAEKFTSIWIDNMSTMVMTMTGTAEGDAVTMTGTMPDIQTGGTTTLRSVQKMVDENTFFFEMFSSGPDGKEFKNMEITYTRSGDSATKAGY